MKRAVLILLLAALSFVGYRAWVHAQYVPASEVRASIEARLSAVRAEVRAKPSTTAEGDAQLARTLRAAQVFDDAIDGTLSADLEEALSTRWDEEAWASLSPEQKALIASHPPVSSALAAWSAGAPFADDPVGNAGSLSLHFQLVWLGEDVAAAAGNHVHVAGSLIDALQVVAELYATQDDMSWLEGSRVLARLEPRLAAKLGGVSEASRQEMVAAARLLKERIPERTQFLAQTQVSELEDALELAAVTGRGAAEVVDKVYRYTQALETCIPELTAVAALPTSSAAEVSVREAELARLAQKYDELPLGPSVLSSLCFNTLLAADACHANLAAILELLDV